MDPQKTPSVAEKPPMPAVDSTLKKESIPTQRIRPLYRMTQIIWYIVAFVEVFLALRFFLKLLGANPNAGFSKLVYGLTWLFAGPFQLVFRVSSVTTGSVFEWSTLLAMAIYVLFGWLIVKAVLMSKPVTTEEADKKLTNQEKS